MRCIKITMKEKLRICFLKLILEISAVNIHLPEGPLHYFHIDVHTLLVYTRNE